jgi:hypothetical protein
MTGPRDQAVSEKPTLWQRMAVAAADSLPAPVGTRVELQLKGKRDPEPAYRLAV